MITTRGSNIEQTTTTSITTLDKNNNITIYPNPVENELNISAENTNVMNIEIYNIEGKMVFMKSFNNSKANVNISDLEVGVYVVSVKDENNNVLKTERIIKK